MRAGLRGSTCCLVREKLLQHLPAPRTLPREGQGRLQTQRIRVLHVPVPPFQVSPSHISGSQLLPHRPLTFTCSDLPCMRFQTSRGLQCCSHSVISLLLSCACSSLDVDKACSGSCGGALGLTLCQQAAFHLSSCFCRSSVRLARNQPALPPSEALPAPCFPTAYITTLGL